MKKRILSLVLAVLMAAALCACGGGKSNQAKPTNEPGGSAGVMAEGGEITVPSPQTWTPVLTHTYLRRRQEPERSSSTSLKGS